MKTHKKAQKGKTMPREGGYKPKGNKSPKTTKRKSHHAPHTMGNHGKGRSGAGNGTVKNAA